MVIMFSKNNRYLKNILKKNTIIGAEKTGGEQPWLQVYNPK